MEKRVDFKISYDGGLAASGLLNIYDAGESLRGLARALAITTHAFLNDGEVRVRADRLDGAEIYVQAPQRGSFQEVVSVIFADPAAQGVGLSIVANAFYDFMKWTWRAATGEKDGYEPETAFVKKFAERQEPVLGEIASGLESALHQLHRPIERENPITITIVRPRVGDIIVLDNKSLAYVGGSHESKIIHDVLGNVTKYNLLSGFGRFYDDSERRTVSFDLDESVSMTQRRHLTWSMHQRSRNLEGKLLLDVKRITTASGELKRYKVYGVSRLEQSIEE